jgi:hypothetical protein
MYLIQSVMKRVLLMALVVVSIFAAQAQVCTPDMTITEPGVYPDQPDTAYADQPYSFNFQVLALRDTNVVFAGQNLDATIDSVRINNVIGLPASFTFQCNPLDCMFTWLAVGCINLQGNPTQSQAGVYPLEIATTVFARAGILALPVPDTADGYELVIQGDGSASVFDVSANELRVYPNPSASGKYTLSSNQPLSIINIINVQGKSVTYDATPSQKQTYIDLNSVPKGIYIVQAYLGEERVSIRLLR